MHGGSFVFSTTFISFVVTRFADDEVIKCCNLRHNILGVGPVAPFVPRLVFVDRAALAYRWPGKSRAGCRRAGLRSYYSKGAFRRWPGVRSGKGSCWQKDDGRFPVAGKEFQTAGRRPITSCRSFPAAPAGASTVT